MIIDCQHHFYPRALAEKHGYRPGETSIWYENAEYWLTFSDALVQIEEHLKQMDMAGIDVAVLHCLEPPRDECKAINDSLAELQKRYPGRFVGLAHLPVFSTKEAIEELDRAVNVLGLRGIAVITQPEYRPLDSPELWPF